MNNHSETIAKFPSAAVYLNSELLKMFQLPAWRVEKDSKTLVDRPLKFDPDDVLDSLGTLAVEENLDEFRMKQFLTENFFDHPSEDKSIVVHTPNDYDPELPLFADASSSNELRRFAGNLKHRWLELSRRFAMMDHLPAYQKYEELPQLERSSLIPLPYPFFIPGGRFREVYYWDSLWIVHGLIASDMLESAMGVVRNLLYLVQVVGFVPNGNRVYYLNRSQPPVLPEAVKAVFDALSTNNKKCLWLEECVPILTKEYDTFMACRRANLTDNNGEQTPLCVYNVDTNKPRPESYKEDVETAVQASLKRSDSKSRIGPCLDEVSNLMFANDSGKSEQMYCDLASGAESGWDFSSRWFGSDKRGLSSIRTSKIIPACLNSILLLSEKNIADFHRFLHEQTGDEDHAQECNRFKAAAKNRSAAMNEHMWCSVTKMWRDFDLEKKVQTDSESAAGLMPLWARIWEDSEWCLDDAKDLIAALEESVLYQPGGLATTTRTSHEQWDFPNTWAPLADVVVDGLNALHRDFPTCGAANLAREIALRTLRVMYQGWAKENVMHEKYNALEADGTRGEGGEYEPQTGFGWSNGVALKMMKAYCTEIEEVVTLAPTKAI